MTENKPEVGYEINGVFVNVPVPKGKKIGTGFAHGCKGVLPVYIYDSFEAFGYNWSVTNSVVSKGFRVTHVESGRAVGGFSSKTVKEARVEGLKLLGNLSQDTIDKAIGKALKALEV